MRGTFFLAAGMGGNKGWEPLFSAAASGHLSADPLCNDVGKLFLEAYPIVFLQYCEVSNVL